MKILRTTYLIKVGEFGNSPEWELRHTQIIKAISGVEWPVGSGSFTLNNIKMKNNGVVPIKESCMADLKNMGWGLETRFSPSAEKNQVHSMPHVEKRERFCVWSGKQEIFHQVTEPLIRWPLA